MSTFRDELHQLCAAAVPDVLETMFFVNAVEDSAPPPPDPLVVDVGFRGSRSGVFTIRLSAGVARDLASGFLGVAVEQVTTGQAIETACELANMLCGGVLSRSETECGFDLEAPVAATEPYSPLTPVVYRTQFLLDNGGWLELEFRVTGGIREAA